MTSARGVPCDSASDCAWIFRPRSTVRMAEPYPALAAAAPFLGRLPEGGMSFAAWPGRYRGIWHARRAASQPRVRVARTVLRQMTHMGN